MLLHCCWRRRGWWRWWGTRTTSRLLRPALALGRRLRLLKQSAPPSLVRRGVCLDRVYRPRRVGRLQGRMDGRAIPGPSLGWEQGPSRRRTAAAAAAATTSSSSSSSSSRGRRGRRAGQGTSGDLLLLLAFARRPLQCRMQAVQKLLALLLLLLRLPTKPALRVARMGMPRVHRVPAMGSAEQRRPGHVGPSRRDERWALRRHVRASRFALSRVRAASRNRKIR